VKLYLVIPGKDCGGEEFEKLVCAVSPLNACELVPTDNHENVLRFDPSRFRALAQRKRQRQ
jgi:hypothetical protein